MFTTEAVTSACQNKTVATIFRKYACTCIYLIEQSHVVYELFVVISGFQRLSDDQTAFNIDQRLGLQ